MGPNPTGLIPGEEVSRVQTYAEGRLRKTQGEESQLQATESGLRRNQQCQHVDLLGSRAEGMFACLSHQVCNTLMLSVYYLLSAWLRVKAMKEPWLYGIYLQQ